jgi:hypothetical protein
MSLLEKKTVKELREKCKILGIKGYSTMKKQELIELIKEKEVEELIEKVENVKLEEEITIESDYNKLKEYYDEVLNKDNKLIKTSNDEPTPIDCVEEMISKITEEFWKNKELKILDPCCGCGNFPIVIYNKLINYHSKEHILKNILYFNDLNNNRLDVLRSIFGININVYNEDYLCMNIDIEFDLIVANPPYAKLLANGKRASKNHNMIGLFIEKSFNMLKEGGYILYITPDNWMSYADRNTLIKRLTSKQIHYINIHIAKKYFKKVGSSFVWYLIENKDYYKNINIEGIWKGKEYSSIVSSELRSYIPLYYKKIIQNILHKTIDNNNIKKFKVETSSNLHKYTKREYIRVVKDEIYKYKLIHTPNQTVWASKPHIYQEGYKVFISTTSYYGTFVDNCGMTQSIAFIRCESEEEANKINEVLKHPLYKFLNDICRYGNFNNIRILQRLPYCNSYNNVYDKLGITNEEKKFIYESL